MDLDHFKKINDTHGHSTGDDVLIELTKCIATIICNTDIFGRFGGEEFILFMPHTTLDQATLLAERIRAEIAALQIQTQDAQVTTTVGLGVAVVDENAETLDALIINADLALYRAKDNGRNRVEVYNESFHKQ